MLHRNARKFNHFEDEPQYERAIIERKTRAYEIGDPANRNHQMEPIYTKEDVYLRRYGDD